MEIDLFDASRDFELYLEGDIEAFKESFPGVTVTSDLIRDIRTGIAGIANNEYMAAFTAVIDREPVGFIIVSMQWLFNIRQGYVDSIFVKGNHRSKGIGSQLLLKAESWAKGMGAHFIRLDVSLGNTAAIAAYEKAGLISTRVQMEKAI